MPIRIQNDLPAKAILEQENIFVMDETRAMSQDIRPLQILILNLMPLKEDTELQLLRSLSNTPLQVDCSFLMTSSHEATHTSKSHISKFYLNLDEVRRNYYDGMIITGAPVENLPYEEVTYWAELCRIMEWSKTHVTSTLHLCWGAQAALYYHYGIPKYPREKKLSGIYRHRVYHHSIPLIRDMDDYIDCPHSRWTEIRKQDVRKHPELITLAESDEAGILLLMDREGKQIFVQGHPEYDRMTLDTEFHRDRGRGMDARVPVNYYEDDDPNSRPVLSWRNMANTLYTNWLNYYVYQVTPYLLDREDGQEEHHDLS